MLVVAVQPFAEWILPPKKFLGMLNTHTLHFSFRACLVYYLCNYYVSFVISLSGIVTSSMLAKHCLTAHCLIIPCKLLGVKGYNTWIIFMQGNLYVKLMTLNRFCMLCLYTIALAFVWPGLSHEAWHTVLFLNIWFGCHSSWLWACLLQLTQMYTKKHFLQISL